MSRTVKMEQQQPEACTTIRRGVVAIVDDDPQVSRALGAWLDFHGLLAAHHDTGESLLQAIHQDAGLLTLPVGVGDPGMSSLVGAVLDLNLSGITGVGLAQSLRRLKPDLPIAIITAQHADLRARYGRPPAGVRFLQKPFDLHALEEALFPLFADQVSNVK